MQIKTSHLSKKTTEATSSDNLEELRLLINQSEKTLLIVVMHYDGPLKTVMPNASNFLYLYLTQKLIIVKLCDRLAKVIIQNVLNYYYPIAIFRHGKR